MSEFYYAKIDKNNKVIETGSLGKNLEDIEKLTANEGELNLPVHEDMVNILKFCDNDIEKISKPVNHFFKTIETMREAEQRSILFEPLFKDLNDIKNRLIALEDKGKNP
jgi:hypothetical protein